MRNSYDNCPTTSTFRKKNCPGDLTREIFLLAYWCLFFSKKYKEKYAMALKAGLVFVTSRFLESEVWHTLKNGKVTLQSWRGPEEGNLKSWPDQYYKSCAGSQGSLREQTLTWNAGHLHSPLGSAHEALSKPPAPSLALFPCTSGDSKHLWSSVRLLQ